MALVHICSAIKNNDGDFRLMQKYLIRLEKYDDVSAFQSLENHKHYEKWIYFKKFSNNKRRLIIEVIKENNKNIFLLRNIIERRNDKEYDKFLDNITDWLKRNPLSENDQNSINILGENESEYKPQPLTEEYADWLDLPSMDFGVSIFESKEWLKPSSKTFNKYWMDYHGILLNLIDGSGKTTIVPDTQLEIISSKDNKKHILFQRISFSTENNTNMTAGYFLFDYFDNIPDDSTIGSILNKYSISEGFESKIDMLPSARRAYPDWILADEDVWHSLQCESSIETEDNQIDLANLALSAEEMKILKDPNMPMFINGHAGSGKSTILYYLFAEYLRKYLTKVSEKSSSPLFLTYSDNLLNESKKMVKEILIKNPYFELNIEDKVKIIDKYLPRCLFSFQDFIINHLFRFSLKDIFSRDDSIIGTTQHLNYAIFKRLYNMDTDLPEKYLFRGRKKQELSPSIVWHTIRALIKGHKFIDEITPELYFKQFSEDNRSVDREVFTDIFNNIYKPWYKKLTLTGGGGYWDDMDLIRHALHLVDDGEKINKYPVIICDEAQDFSQAEFQLILETQKLIEFDLSYHKFNSIPVAFAGDHLQTINPTGFRWENLKSNYYDVVNSLNISENNKKLKKKSLEINYRSGSGIVDLANWLQFYRHKVLQNEYLKEFKPQESWKKEEFSPKIFIEEILNDASIDVKSYLTNTIIIIPAEEGEEENFIRNDDLLSQFNYDDIIENVFTAATIKGLEFSKVLLYKIGDYEDKGLEQLFSFELDHKMSESKNIDISYYFNKIYVSVTRARDNLFIYDTQKGMNQLWDYFTKKKFTDISKRREFTEKINPDEFNGYVVIGQNDEIIELEDKHPLVTAKYFERKGIQQESSDHMRRASSFYRRAENFTKSRECLALSYEYDKKWKKAGDEYNKIIPPLYHEASICYWKGLCWVDLSEITSVPGQTSSQFMYFNPVANFMKDDKSDLKILETNIFIRDVFNSINATKPWEEVMDEVFSLLNGKMKDLDIKWEYYAGEIHSLILRVPKLFNKNDFSFLAEYFFLGNSFFQASEYWEKAEKINIPKYYWSKYLSSKTPNEKILYLRKLSPNQKYQDLLVSKEIHDIMNGELIDNENEVLKTAEYFFKHREYTSSINYWDKCTHNNNEEYLIAKIHLSKSKSEKLYYMLSHWEKWESSSNNYYYEIEQVWKSIKSDANAIKQYSKYGNKHLLVRLLKSKENVDYKSIYNIINSLQTFNDWVEMIQLINDNRQPETYRKKIVYAISYNVDSQETFDENMDKMSAKERRRIINFLKHEIDGLINSKIKNLSTKQLLHTAIASEKVIDNPKFKYLLKIYEEILKREKTGRKLTKKVRKRWVAIKARMLEFELNKIEEEPDNHKRKYAATELENEIQHKKAKWRIRDDIESFLTPFSKADTLGVVLNDLMDYIIKNNANDNIDQMKKVISRAKKERDKDMFDFYIKNIVGEVYKINPEKAKGFLVEINKHNKKL